MEAAIQKSVTPLRLLSITSRPKYIFLVRIFVPHRHVVFASSGGNFEGIYRHKFDGIPSRSRNPIVKQLMIGCFSDDLYAVILDTKLENRSGSPHLWIRGKNQKQDFFFAIQKKVVPLQNITVRLQLLVLNPK